MFMRIVKGNRGRVVLQANSEDQLNAAIQQVEERARSRNIGSIAIARVTESIDVDGAFDADRILATIGDDPSPKDLPSTGPSSGFAFS